MSLRSRPSSFPVNRFAGDATSLDSGMCLCGYACRYFPFYRGRRALENRTHLDDDKIEMLEQMLKDATESANESERKYEEVRFLSRERI